MFFRVFRVFVGEGHGYFELCALRLSNMNSAANSANFDGSHAMV